MHPELDYSVIAVDFDGTLSVEHKYPEIGEPNELLMGFLKACQKEGGHKIILWTCRTGKELDAAVEFCAEYGLIFDAVNENVVDFETSNKIYADTYIDDRAEPIQNLMEDLYKALQNANNGE